MKIKATNDNVLVELILHDKADASGTGEIVVPAENFEMTDARVISSGVDEFKKGDRLVLDNSSVMERRSVMIDKKRCYFIMAQDILGVIELDKKKDE